MLPRPDKVRNLFHLSTPDHRHLRRVNRWGVLIVGGGRALPLFLAVPTGRRRPVATAGATGTSPSGQERDNQPMVSRIRSMGLTIGGEGCVFGRQLPGSLGILFKGRATSSAQFPPE
jgi:hypothetical protein